MSFEFFPPREAPGIERLVENVAARLAEFDPEWAWAPFEPDAERPWTPALASHLFRRAGFGATWAELQQALADGPETTVRRLLRLTLSSGALKARIFPSLSIR